MSLNGRIALVAVAALVAAPLWLPLLPIGWLWWRHLRAQAQSQGFLTLNMLQARTIAAHAEASLPVAPQQGWMQVAHNVDRYLAKIDSPRHWRSTAVLVALEFAPLLRLYRPLSRLPLAKRRIFLERHLTTTKGLLAIPALARQLIRMGYYTDPAIAQSLGFRTVQQRRSPVSRAQVTGPAAATPTQPTAKNSQANKAVG